MVLRLFMRDVKWAGITALIALFLLEAIALAGYWIKQQKEKSLISLYQSFLEKSPDNGIREITTLLNNHTISDSQRALLFHSVISEEKNPALLQIKNLDPSVFTALLTNRTKTFNLIQTTQKELAELRFDWAWQFRYAYYVLIWGSTLCLLFHWTNSGNARIMYFPVKYWWFYLYLLLAFPASLLLPAIVLSVMGVKYLIRHIQKEKIEEPQVPSYDEVCATILAKTEDTKKKWNDLFSTPRLYALYDEHLNRLSEVKNTLQNIGRELQAKEKDYFREKEQVELLREDTAHKEAITALTEIEWTDLINNPLVKALDIKDDAIEIYTDYLPNPLIGVVGPFRIEINTNQRPFRINGTYLAHKNGVNHPQGAGTGDHCFGNVSELISKLLRECRIGAATGVMLRAFQSN